ncbi:MAG: metallophosphoesterase [Crocinitomicaceae bacterium]|nr:metallophosphoesterase [Crocinitomicaceae bacterium]
MKYIFLSLVLVLFSCDKNEDGTTEESPISYSFFIAGHTYGSPGVDNDGLHPAFKNKFDLIQSDGHIGFGVLTGDIVITGTEQNWNEVDNDIIDLGLPVYFAAGNHDMTDRVLFESRYGQTYYSFVHQSDLFIVLDPNLDEWNISDDQLQFLENALNSEAQNVNNIFVFFHQVLWWEPDNIYQNVTLNSLAGRADTINFWNEIEPLFNGLSKPVHMFAGDVGAFNTGSEFMYHQYENITLIASGMGGNVRDNIIIIDVHEDASVSYRLIALNDPDINALGDLLDYELP